jgi:hypothetical protein
MNKTSTGLCVAALSALLGACGGDDAGEQYCEILFPIVAAALAQGEQGALEYCLECEVGGETYLVVDSWYDGVTATPIQEGSEGCGNLQIFTSPLASPGTYTFPLRTYQVGDYGEYGEYDYERPAHAYEPAAALGPVGATVTVEVTGEDCFDGTDDDGDGGVDCDDTDNCMNAPACLGIEDCGNFGRDDDGDGTADCDDTDCEYDLACTQ